MARVLVVEDEKVIAWHIEQTLERLGHTVVASLVSGAKAIQIAEETKPDLVLMDVRLKGGIDGITAAEQIYARFDIPIVYLTAHTDDTTLERAKHSAPFGYLVKPLREHDLQTTIEIILHRHRLEQYTKVIHPEAHTHSWQRIEKYLEVLQDEGKYESNLANRLLDFQSTSTSIESLSLTSIDLQQWLPQVINRFTDLAVCHQHTIVRSISPTIPTILLHLPSLEQIVDELLNNACYYTLPMQSITITAEAKNNILKLSVTNTGIEISPNEQERIFQPFYRILHHNPWHYNGIGLGLTLINRSIARLGGQIFVRSGDRVTTFAVVLPLMTN
ncbi:MAG: hybrid sensor histidine kinase/response regulator [Cyanobacteria bacterium CRU_2_1]|nr:hybrid sensor histidine kinase/response regulator [Cyanobacteria bacterium RU_5_0]NJR59709.1 hybrid sensor histidine kinase/response regulator [Cyanobacteria bacterium CRU_2_1]